MSDKNDAIAGRPFFCSWSGGKDSCLAMYRAIQSGGKPQSLLTVLSEDGINSRSHGLPKAVLEEQGKSLGLKSAFCSATWAQYEETFIGALREYKKAGIEVGVFGDIDVEAHLEWVRRVCKEAGIVPVHPLWHGNRRQLLEEFIALGFKAQVVVVNGKLLDPSFLGKTIDFQTIMEMEKAGIDPSGELGEYHTVVVDGPIFSHRIDYRPMVRREHDGYWFLQSEGVKA